MNPDFPIVSGHYTLTNNWSIDLSERYNRRVEDRSMVLWRPGITAWLMIWGNEKIETPDERLQWVRADVSDEAFDVREDREGSLARLTYRLEESSDDRRLPALYGFVIGLTGHVQIAVYFDEVEQLGEAETLINNLREDAHLVVH